MVAGVACAGAAEDIGTAVGEWSAQAQASRYSNTKVQMGTYQADLPGSLLLIAMPSSNQRLAALRHWKHTPQMMHRLTKPVMALHTPTPEQAPGHVLAYAGASLAGMGC